MKTILRKGSLVIIERDNGELWLTRRFKKKKDGHRSRLIKHTVRHAPIIRIPKKGDWLFTCSLYPLQFEKALTDYKLEDWFEYFETKKRPFDDFETNNGSHHSWNNCSLSLISNEYAEWFIKHKVADLFYDEGRGIQVMDERIKTLCNMCNIKYEGW